MADLPAVQEYQSRVAEREQRVNSLTAELEQRNRDINEEQSRLSQSIRNVNFRRGPPVRPTVQKIKLLTGNFESNRRGFETFQSDAQRIIEQENSAVESSYQRALAAQQAESLRQQELASKYSSGNLSLDEFGEISGGSFESQFGKKSSDALEFAYYKYLVSHGKNLSQDEERNFAIAGGIIGKEARQELGGGLNKIVLGASVQTTKSSSTPSSDQKLIIQGEAVVYKYFNPGKNATVFVTSTGREYVQGVSKNQVGASASQSIVPVKNLLSLKKGITTSEIKGDPFQASFVKANTLTEFGNFVANQGFQKGVRSKYDSPIPFPNKNTTNKFNKSILTGTPLYDLGVLELEVGRGILKGSGETLEKAKLIATPTVKVVADISRPIRQTTEYKNILLASQQVSEAPFSIGAETYRRIAETGRGIGKGLYESTGLSISINEKGQQSLQFVGESQRRPIEETNRLLSPKEFEFYRERQAITGGALVSLLPYAAGGMVLNAQRVADIGSALNKSPTEAAKLVGVGIASTVLFNELGSVNRVIKGQLGGTVVGSVGFAKSFEDVTQTGGKLLGLGLLIPYAAQELPPLVSSFEKADANAFQRSLSNIQTTSASLFVGQQIGQRLSTGFTLFSGTQKAITTGGLTSPTETLARKRLIANTFDAKYVEPSLTGQQTKRIKDLLEQGGRIKRVDARGDVTIEFEKPNTRLTPTEIKSEGMGVTTILGPAQRRNITITPPPTAFEVRQLYESQGFTKQKFLESYQTIFGKLPGTKVPVKEYDVSNVEAIAGNKKAQKVLLEYFQANTKKFSIYGSGVQGPQLEGVDIRQSGDIDTVAKNPKEFGEGLLKAFKKAGFSQKDFGIFKDVPGEFSIYAGTDKAKFLNIHPYKDNYSFIFSQAEEVTGIIPRRIFTQTPSGISITNIGLQGQRKIVGGFVDLRPKDVGDVATISEGVQSFLSKQGVVSNSISFAYKEIESVPGFVSRFILRPEIKGVEGYQGVQSAGGNTIKSVSSKADTRFSLKPLGVLETNLGVYPKGANVSSVLNIGEDSAPVKEISRITGLERGRVVEVVGRTKLDVLVGVDKATKGGFVTGKEAEAIAAGITEPTIGVRRFQGIFGTEKVLSHEIAHSADNAAGLLGKVDTSIPYQSRPQEIRAFAVEEKFIQSRGRNPILEEPGIATFDFQLGRSFFASPPSKSVASVGAESSGPLFLKSSARLVPSFLDNVVSGTSNSSFPDYYSSVVQRSYPVYFPATKKSAYVSPKKLSLATYVPPKSVSSIYIPATLGRSPYVPPVDNYIFPKKVRLDVPYTPPGGPPNIPLLPPDNPPYVPYTPPEAPRYIPPSPTTRPSTTFFTSPRAGPTRVEEKKISQNKIPSFQGFDVFVLKNVEGKQQFLEVDGKGTSLIQQDALRFGENVTDRSLEASFFIKQSRSPVVGLSGLPNLSNKFRISKQRIRKTIPVYVEIESYRLDTQSEVKKIHAAKIAAQIRKTNLIKPKSRSKTTKRKPFGFNVI